MIQFPPPIFELYTIKNSSSPLIIKKEKKVNYILWTLIFILYFNLDCNVSNVSI